MKESWRTYQWNSRSAGHDFVRASGRLRYIIAATVIRVIAGDRHARVGICVRLLAIPNKDPI